MLTAEYHYAIDETPMRVRFDSKSSAEIDNSSEEEYGSEIFTIDKPEMSREVCLDSLIEDLKNLYIKKNYCDVVLRADGLSLPAHKKNIVLQISHFQSSVQRQFGPKPDDLQWDEAIQLLHAAKKHQVPSLEVECCTFMKSHLSISNVCEAFDEPFKCQNTEL
ncbi:hypothetical protein CEXT_600221 [Caerostris extrusa]|uniref:BTB domain-containing protein n=1 Tax=Caerostris extrusa TaxID=172846 RepID=A0AAV4S5K5_CAEEX|nr:hypothetical protein CEXT_600221 [Caerostris extrusa]